MREIKFRAWIDSLKENKKLKDEISELKLSFSTWVQENTKLKAEINRLIGKSGMYRDMADSFCESNKKLKAEIEQLRLYATNIINARNLSEETATSIQEKMRRELILQRENERLRESRDYLSEVNESLVRINDKQDREITKLKDELEQLKEQNNHYFEQYASAIDEIEQLKILAEEQSKLTIEQFKQIDEQYQEIEQLKSELEQSVKLPCKVGDMVYDNDFGKPTPSTIVGYSFGNIFQDDYSEIEEEQIYFYSKSNRFNIETSFASSEIGKTIFLNKKEAEQSLKGVNDESKTN